eukprot:gb/GEZN01006825.1/.p1 GENE.gb/GEZN01006825.1/~~gb/GEZN01006825.1/.p1  ORF type:complete len:462 (+),score=63.95 gb/GEZN01006825.1/:159-1544(+)
MYNRYESFPELERPPSPTWHVTDFTRSQRRKQRAAGAVCLSVGAMVGAMAIIILLLVFFVPREVSVTAMTASVRTFQFCNSSKEVTLTYQFSLYVNNPNFAPVVISAVALQPWFAFPAPSDASFASTEPPSQPNFSTLPVPVSNETSSPKLTPTCTPSLAGSPSPSAALNFLPAYSAAFTPIVGHSNHVAARNSLGSVLISGKLKFYPYTYEALLIEYRRQCGTPAFLAPAIHLKENKEKADSTTIPHEQEDDSQDEGGRAAGKAHRSSINSLFQPDFFYWGSGERPRSSSTQSRTSGFSDNYFSSRLPKLSSSSEYSLPVSTSLSDPSSGQPPAPPSPSSPSSTSPSLSSSPQPQSPLTPPTPSPIHFDDWKSHHSSNSSSSSSTSATASPPASSSSCSSSSLSSSSPSLPEDHKDLVPSGAFWSRSVLTVRVSFFAVTAQQEIFMPDILVPCIFAQQQA